MSSAVRPCRTGERELAGVIRSSAKTLEHLVSEILDLARIEAGAVVLDNAPFHLGDAIRTVAAAARVKAQEKTLTLDLAVHPMIDRAVLGDETRFKQILTNLLSNAVKFTATGSIRVTADPLDGDRFRLSVADTGIGFGPDQKARLFRRFEQADASVTRRYGGAGLGLATCEQLTTKLGGRIDCESAPGEGTVFTIDLPFAPAAMSPAGEPVTPVAERPLKVLVVDDRAVNRQVADIILRRAGAETAFAEDGAEAVAMARGGGFDLVLMDIQMPRMDGFSAVREIRAGEARSGRPRTPILMLSANALPQHVEEARGAGADGHLSKPITADRLLAEVNAVLRS